MHHTKIRAGYKPKMYKREPKVEEAVEVKQVIPTLSENPDRALYQTAVSYISSSGYAPSRTPIFSENIHDVSERNTWVI